MKQNFNIQLTSEEKKRIFKNLEAMVMATPTSTPSFIQLIQSPFYAFQFSRVKVSVLAALAIFILSGGVSLAASHSLPGDTLYLVKTNFNEKVAGFFILNAEARASYEAGIAFRRLEEAEKLGVMGRLDAETKAEIESNFNKHAHNVEVQLAHVDSIASREAQDDFQSGLEAHQNLLIRLAAKLEGKEEGHLDTLAVKVGNQLSSTSNTKISSQGNSQASVSKQKVKNIENQLEKNLQGIVNIHTGASVDLDGK